MNILSSDFERIESSIMHHGGKLARQYLNRKEGFIASVIQDSDGRIDRNRAIEMWKERFMRRHERMNK